jgi:phage I-like protein
MAYPRNVTLMTSVLLDLGSSDVHVDSAPGGRKKSKMTIEQLKKALADKEITQEQYDAKKKLLDDGGDATEMGNGPTPAPPPASSAEMTDRGEGVLIEMKSAESSAPVWIQIAKQGAFRGHAAGKFEMNAQTFTEIIANFNAQSNKFIPIDFEHASEQHPTHGSIPHSGAPAQGWITQLELRADGNLYGLTTWGDLARGYIKKGQYKFLSPAIVFGAKDRVTGKSIGARLSSAALTNNPFLDGMQPLAAKHTEKSSTVDPTAMSAIRTSLDLPEYLDQGAVLYTLSTIGEDTKRADKLRDALRLPLTMSAKDVFNEARIACGAINPPTVAVAPVTNNDNEPPTAERMTNMAGENKDKDTEISALTLKLSASEGRATALQSEHVVQMKAIVDENAALKLRIEQFETREVEALVDTAMSVWGEKKSLTAESRPHLMRMAKNDREGFVALFPPPVKGAPPPPPAKLMAAGQHVVAPTTTPVEASPGAQIVNMAEIDHSVPSHEDLAAKLIMDAKAIGKLMTREEAFNKAFTERKRLVTAAAQKAFVGTGG